MSLPSSPSLPGKLASPSERPPSFRRLPHVKTVPVFVIDAAWRTHLEYFRSIGSSRHAAKPVEFQELDYTSKDLLPKIYSSEGDEFVTFGPISIVPISGHSRACIRLVLLSLFDHKKQRILQALAWQGADALHLLSEPRVGQDLRARMRHELRAATTTYIHHFFNVDRATDWFLDCEMDV